jgi:hypothetical protein
MKMAKLITVRSMLKGKYRNLIAGKAGSCTEVKITKHTDGILELLEELLI